MGDALQARYEDDSLQPCIGLWVRSDVLQTKGCRIGALQIVDRGSSDLTLCTLFVLLCITEGISEFSDGGNALRFCVAFLLSCYKGATLRTPSALLPW